MTITGTNISSFQSEQMLVKTKDTKIEQQYEYPEGLTDVGEKEDAITVQDDDPPLDK